MASIHDPIRDCGPEFARRIDREVQRAGREIARRFFEIARTSGTGREAAEHAQEEADRLLMLSDEEAGHAVDR